MFQIDLDRAISLLSAIQRDTIHNSLSRCRIKFQSNLELVCPTVSTKDLLILVINNCQDKTIDRIGQLFSLLPILLKDFLDLIQKIFQISFDHFSLNHIVRNNSKVGDIIHSLRICSIQLIRCNRIGTNEFQESIILHSRESMDNSRCSMTIRYIRLLKLQIFRSCLSILICYKDLILDTEIFLRLKVRTDLQSIQTKDRNRFIFISSALRIDQHIFMDRTIDRHTINLRTDFDFDLRGSREIQILIDTSQEILNRICLLHSSRNGIIFPKCITFIHIIMQLRIPNGNLVQLLCTLRNNPNRLLITCSEIG